MCIPKSMTRQSKPSPPNAPLSPSLLSMTSESYTTTATMVNSPTTHSNKHAHDACQQLTFCGVNAHFQNGIAKRPIRDLSESAQKQSLHARARWPTAVHFALWPYALRNVTLLHNSLPVLEDGTSRLKLFSSICGGANMKHMHTFGCPVFALQNVLALGKQLPRWSPRARLGLNLGPSPMHGRNVYLVLNLSTGCVSPQYHCCFDNFSRLHITTGLTSVAPSAGSY
jgi:hypothetical protein